MHNFDLIRYYGLVDILRSLSIRPGPKTNFIVGFSLPHSIRTYQAVSVIEVRGSGLIGMMRIANQFKYRMFIFDETFHCNTWMKRQLGNSVVYFKANSY